MNPLDDYQLTTEGRLLCGGINIAGMFEQNRVQLTNPEDEEAAAVLRELLAALKVFRLEAAQWPDASH